MSRKITTLTADIKIKLTLYVKSYKISTSSLKNAGKIHMKDKQSLRTEYTPHRNH